MSNILTGGKFVSHVEQPEINAEKISMQTMLLGSSLENPNTKFIGNLTDLRAALEAEAVMADEDDYGPRM